MSTISDSDYLRQIQEGTSVGVVERKIEINARFYMHATQDEVATKREGRPIFKDTPYVMRQAVGNKDFMSAPVQLSDQMNFPKEWAQFLAWLKDPKTHIRSLPKLTPAIYRTCEELQIPTIEDLAEATVPPELAEAQRIAKLWIQITKSEVGKDTIVAPAKNKGGRPKGSKNKAKTSAEDAKVAA